MRRWTIGDTVIATRENIGQFKGTIHSINGEFYRLLEDGTGNLLISFRAEHLQPWNPDAKARTRKGAS
jgi:hypothetical protein